MKKTKGIVGILIFIISIIAGIYLGGWLMFLSPIINCCRAIDSGDITAIMVFITIVKCIFSSVVITIIPCIGKIIQFIITE